MKRDLIISFFAWPDSPAQRDIIMGGAWADTPIVYNVGKSGNWDLSRLAAAGGGSILTGILNEAMRPSMAPGRSPLGVTAWGRVCVLSFSEGTAGARKIMVNPKDAARIDAFISLDSTAVSKTFVNWDAQGYGWDQYAQFGTYALDGSCLQVFLHTDITNKNADVASTGDTAKKVFSYLHNTFDAVNAEIKRNGGVSPLDFAPGYLTDRLNEGPRYFAPDPSTRVIVEDQIGNNFRIRLPTPIPFSAKCKSEGVCQGPGGVMVCEGGVGCAHTACAVDFARGVMDTYLTPRWNNPEKFSCIGENCLRPFSKDPPLSGLAGWDAALAKSRALRSGGGFAGLAGLGAFGDDVRPTTKEIDMGSLRAEFDALGLPRWDILNTGIAVAGAAAVAAGLSYLVLKD